jgi:peptidoglycan/xylan/chitin deacetylase (PgdA/CDA1 family)
MSLRQKMLMVAKALGGFALARILTKQGLRVLCYHGISFGDEHEFQPKLFMREDTFRKRMAHLKHRGYPVLALDEALRLMDHKMLPPRALVITFDDGWLGIGAKAAPVLCEHEFPSTVYVTTKDVVDKVPVFDVALRYLIWKGRSNKLNMDFLGLGSETVLLDSRAGREHAASHISEVGARWNGYDKKNLLIRLANMLGVDWEPSGSNSLFRLMTLEQLAQLPAQGMDLQLHTHHHNLPFDRPETVESEIVDNRAVLERVVNGRPLVHFCYPSGEFHVAQFPWLKAMGIQSATTCLSGFNYPNTERLELRRFLDGENITQIEFEAEVSGFLELMRKLRQIVKGTQSGAAIGA